MQQWDWNTYTLCSENLWCKDMSAAPASGAWQNAGMIICPCSMSSLASIASGAGINLIHRSADVTLKERRPLIIAPRETPLNLIHLRNMQSVTRAGATIMPFAPAFYNNTTSFKDMMQYFSGRMLDQLHIEHNLCLRWGMTSIDQVPCKTSKSVESPVHPTRSFANTQWDHTAWHDMGSLTSPVFTSKKRMTIARYASAPYIINLVPHIFTRLKNLDGISAFKKILLSCFSDKIHYSRFLNAPEMKKIRGDTFLPTTSRRQKFLDTGAALPNFFPNSFTYFQHAVM